MCSIVRYCKALLLAASHWFIPHVTCVWFCACYWCALPRPYFVHLARSYLWRWRLGRWCLWPGEFDTYQCFCFSVANFCSRLNFTKSYALIGSSTADTKGFKSVLSLGNVVHSDNDESLYACCCTQRVTVKGCHRYGILAVTVHRYLHEVQWS